MVAARRESTEERIAFCFFAVDIFCQRSGGRIRAWMPFPPAASATPRSITAVAYRQSVWYWRR